MINDSSWLRISDVFAPNIRQISWNKVSIYQYPEIRIWVADTVPVPGTCTCCSKISKYPNIRSANPLICCKIAKYPNIRSANPLICCEIAEYAISESIIFYPNGAAKAQNIPKYPAVAGGSLDTEYGIWVPVPVPVSGYQYYSIPYQYQVPVPAVAKSRNIRISGRRIHSFAAKSRSIRISGRRIHSFAAKSRNMRYPNRLFFIRMVLQKRKISQNILQDIGGGPT